MEYNNYSDMSYNYWISNCVTSRPKSSPALFFCFCTWSVEICWEFWENQLFYSICQTSSSSEEKCSNSLYCMPAVTLYNPVIQRGHATYGIYCEMCLLSMIQISNYSKLRTGHFWPKQQILTFPIAIFVCFPGVMEVSHKRVKALCSTLPQSKTIRRRELILRTHGTGCVY